jgi:predicted Zn-dependent protease
MQKLIGAALVATLFGTSYGCGQVIAGAIAAAPAFFISEQQEIAMGQQAAQQVVQKTPIFRDQGVQNYIQQVGTAVAVKSDRPNLQYIYTVLVDPTPNAFALPGGFIFITTSLLKLMANEAQLAGVLAHETGHVAAKHSLQLMRDAAVLQGVEVAALGTNATQTQAIAANVINSLLQNGYGRQKEYEADKLGAIYASRAGYDPNQLPTFLDVLGQATGNSPAWLTLLQDHPATPDRIAALKSLIQQQNLAGNTTNAQVFLQTTAALR